MFVLESMLINFIKFHFVFFWLCTQVLACLEALKCVIPASLVVQTHITCYISSQGPHSLASGGEWPQFTQCLLDLMGFPNDDKAKVTYVTEKLKSHFMCRSRREKRLSGYNYGYFDGRSGTFLRPVKRKESEKRMYRENCSWKKKQKFLSTLSWIGNFKGECFSV